MPSRLGRFKFRRIRFGLCFFVASIPSLTRWAIITSYPSRVRLPLTVWTISLSSSNKRMIFFRRAVCHGLTIFILQGQRNIKGGWYPFFDFNPDRPLMSFYDGFGNCQSHSSSLLSIIWPGSRSVEFSKNSFKIFIINAGTLIFYWYDGQRPFPFHFYMNSSPLFRKFNSIIHQISVPVQCVPSQL